MASTSSTSSSVLLSQSEKDFIRAGCRENCRIDGRKPEELGNYVILTGEAAAATDSARTAASSSNKPKSSSSTSPLIFSNGSARILSLTNGGSSNNLHLLCSIKADVVHPSPHRPNDGVLEFYVDALTPSTTTTSPFSTRKQLEQLQSTLEHLLGSSSSSSTSGSTLVDTGALCLVPNQYVWRLCIDLYILTSPAVDAFGCLLDAASHVIRAALLDTRLPAVTAVPTVQPQQPTATPTTTPSTTPNMELLVDSDYQKSHIPPGAQQAPMIVTVTLLLTTTQTTTSSTGAAAVRILPQTILLLDATAQEEACSHAQVHVALTTTTTDSDNDDDKNKIWVCGVRLSGKGSLPTALLPDCVALAVQAVQDGRIARAFQLVQNNAGTTSCFLPPVYIVQ